MKTAFDKNLHRRYLISLLSEISKTVPEKIAFKGGSCAMLFYDLPRFSFDLDFDILNPLDKKEIDGVLGVLSRQGIVLDAHDKENTLFYLFSYAKGSHKIKIEMNKRIWKNNDYKNIWFMGLPLVIPDETTLFTNKLIALTDRKTPVARDLFDVWFFLSRNFLMREALIKERTGRDIPKYIKYAVRHVRKTYTSRNVLQGLGNALDEGQKDWARDHLISTTIGLLEKQLA